MISTSSKTIDTGPGPFPEPAATRDGGTARDGLPVSIGIAAGLLWMVLAFV